MKRNRLINVYIDTSLYDAVIKIPTKKEMKTFSSAENGLVYYIIKYRNDKIPVYMDDYGQQFFIIINGKTYGMGSFNTCLTDACYIYDKMIDNKNALEILKVLKDNIVSRDGTTTTFDTRDERVKEWLGE